MSDHTTLHWMEMGGDKFEHYEKKVYFKDYELFENMPLACQGDDVKKEHETYWRELKK